MPNSFEQDQLIRLPSEPTDEQIVDGIRQWLELIANEDYEAAVNAIEGFQDAELLRSRIETFFGEELHWRPTAPTQDVLQRTEVYRDEIPERCYAVMGFFIPVVNDEHGTYGIWTTVYLLKSDPTFFNFEIFHA